MSSRHLIEMPTNSMYKSRIIFKLGNRAEQFSLKIAYWQVKLLTCAAYRAAGSELFKLIIYRLGIGMLKKVIFIYRLGESSVSTAYELPSHLTIRCKKKPLENFPWRAKFWRLRELQDKILPTLMKKKTYFKKFWLEIKIKPRRTLVTPIIV